MTTKGFMKQTLYIFLLSLIICLNGRAQTAGAAPRIAPSVLGGDPTASAAVRQQQQEYSKKAFEDNIKANNAAAQQAEMKFIYSKDPWRNLNGTTNSTYTPGWVEFQGQVQEIVDDGVIFNGTMGQVMTVHTGIAFVNNHPYKTYGDDIFFVENFPYPANPRQGYQQLLAFPNGYFTYKNRSGQSVTIPKLNYGIPCVKIWSAEEIAQAQRLADLKKQKAKDGMLKSDMIDAEHHDPYGLLQMARRYRDGNGVETNLPLSKKYYLEAVEKKVPEAVKELADLPAAADLPISGKSE